MGPSDTRIRALETARHCAELGARQRTVAWVTGLASGFILRTLYDKQTRAPKGRPPYKDDFYFRATLRVKVEASSFAVKYRALVVAGYLPSESLVAAYRHYLSLTPAPTFCFDEAFYLVAHLDGIWAARSSTLQLGLCRRCDSQHLVAIGSLAPHGCPFCKPVPDGADAAAGPLSPLSAPLVPSSRHHGVAQAFPQHIDALRFQRTLEDLGAHARVISALLSALPTPFVTPIPKAPSTLVAVRRRLSLHRWSEAVKTPLRAQYGLIAMHYRRLVRAGFSPEHSIVGAYRHVRTLVPEHPICFDRCFEVVSLLEGRWGAPEQELDLVPCGKCGARHLVSRRDRKPPHCPYCALIRFPALFVPREQRPSRAVPCADAASGPPHFRGT